jgi:hypothetical protein
MTALVDEHPARFVERISRAAPAAPGTAEKQRTKALAVVLPLHLDGRTERGYLIPGCNRRRPGEDSLPQIAPFEIVQRVQGKNSNAKCQFSHIE